MVSPPFEVRDLLLCYCCSACHTANWQSRQWAHTGPKVCIQLLIFYVSFNWLVNKSGDVPLLTITPLMLCLIWFSPKPLRSLKLTFIEAPNCLSFFFFFACVPYALVRSSAQSLLPLRSFFSAPIVQKWNLHSTLGSSALTFGTDFILTLLSTAQSLLRLVLGLKHARTRVSEFTVSLVASM